MANSFNSIFIGAAGTSTGIGIGDAPFWINSQYGSSKEHYNSVTSDSNNNVIVCGECESDGAGAGDGLITKYGSDGSLTWTKTLGGSPNDRLEGVDVDSNDNVYVSGYLSYDILTAKFNSSGVSQWQNTRNSTQHSSGNAYDVGWCSTVDANNLIYTGGYARTQQAGADQLYWMRHDSDGNNFLSRSLLGKVNGGGNGGGVWNGVDVDSSGNIFLAGGATSTTSVGSNAGLIAKYNSSAALQFQKQLSDANGIIYYFGIRLDLDGNIYAVGYSAADGQGGNDALIVKYNSSGALQWQKVLGSSGSEAFREVVISPNGAKIWAVGITPEGAGNRAFLITEWDSSGGLTWQRTLGNTGSYESNAEAVRLDSTGALLVAGWVEDLNDHTAVVVKIPNDGSLTGTYGSSPNAYAYAASSLTLATAGSTEAASSHADSSISLSSSNQTGSVADAVLTEITQAVS